MSSRAWPAVLASALLAGAVVAFGVANPVPVARIGTDRLGPDAGEPVADYLARAETTLTVGSPAAGGEPEPGVGAEHWALVSFAFPLTPADLLAAAGDVRVSQVMYQVPLERAQTPIVTVPVAANSAAVLRSAGVASARLHASVAGHDRQSLLAAHSAARLSEGCACAVAATVRGPLDRLRVLRDDPRVRAVEALPADAVAGAFAVSPLLPTQTTAAVPGPDDGPVPGLG